MILPIYAYGTSILREIANDIDPVKDKEAVKTLINDMFETMWAAEGVGLAAPQVGKSFRIFIVDARVYGDEDPSLADFKKVFINAHILDKEGDEGYVQEGCLSIPKIHEDVLRPFRIRMKYLDEEFIEHEEWFEGMAARIIQHEYDHLDGILFPDKLSPLKKRLLKGKLRDISTGKIDVRYKMVFQKKK